MKKKNLSRKNFMVLTMSLFTAAAIVVAVFAAARHRVQNGSDLLAGDIPADTQKGSVSQNDPETSDIPEGEADAETDTTAEAPAESVTDAPTEPATEAPAETATDVPAETATDAPTEAPAEPATDPVLPLDTSAPESGDANYFDSSLFIGDSRTVGLSDYADLGKASVFASLGMNVYRVFKEPVDVPGHGSIMLSDLLASEKYNKIYIMLGINEIGYPAESVIKKYGEIVESVRAAQPDATVYLLANLHITAERSANDEVYNNANLNALNLGMQQYADGSRTVYIDANSLFDDENGGLKKEYAIDDFHLIGRYYAVWADWIKKNS